MNDNDVPWRTLVRTEDNLRAYRPAMRDQNSSEQPGEGRWRCAWRKMTAAPRRLKMIAAWYLVAALFAGGAAAALLLRGDRSTALVAGLLLAAPVVAGLIGDRITGFKAFSFEVSLAEVTVSIEGDFSGAAMTVAEMGPSALPDLSGTLREVIKGRSRVLRLNLRDDDYWWSTRVFLVAALAQDYTEVEALAFVRGGEQRILVGVATPPAVRASLASRFPSYELAYRKARYEVAAQMHRPEEEVNEILSWRWAGAFQPDAETVVKVIVASKDLKDWLGTDLDDDAIPYGPLNPLRRYRIVTRHRRYTALTEDSRLIAIVDRNELTRRGSVAELEQRLS